MDEQATFRRADRPGEGPCLLIAGEIDLAVAGEFAAAIRSLLQAADDAATIDLTQVSFFNSTGIGVLCDAAAGASRQGVALVVRPSDYVRRTLEITGLTETFDLR